MQKIIIITLIILLIPLNTLKFVPQQTRYTIPKELNEAKLLYHEMNLEGLVCFEAFEQAVEGFNKIKKKSKELITLIDYSKPSTEERLFVLDMKSKRLLYKSLVSHGRNSGNLYAKSFSNKYGSYQSSLGFFRTENTYQGKNGYSLILEGLEKGINDKARQRAIVIHGAAYSNPSVIKSSGRLGRSLGCPALPQHISKEIINTIKGGSLLYIYADSPDYLTESPILSENAVERT